MNIRHLLAPAVALGLAVGLTTAPAATAAPAIKARPDSVKVATGGKKAVNVLGNDKVAKKKKASVVIVKKSTLLKAKVNKKRKVVVTAALYTLPGTYTVTYQVTDTKGRTSTAVVTVKVTRKNNNGGSNTTPPATGTTLSARIAALPVATERRTGYNRDSFKHWNAGLNPSDGCDTRREVLISEAVVKPKVGSKCSFTGGKWASYYDGVETTDASKFDIDHVVPLAEAWDSGAHKWTAARREAYANDQGDKRTLVAVSASSNRSKGDKDPAEWMPPSTSVRCRYITEWVAVKTRWGLSVDKTEKQFLTQQASKCADVEVKVKIAP